MAGEAKFSTILTESEMNITFRRWLHAKYPNGIATDPGANNFVIEVAYLAWCAGITYQRELEHFHDNS